MISQNRAANNGPKQLTFDFDPTSPTPAETRHRHPLTRREPAGSRHDQRVPVARIDLAIYTEHPDEAAAMQIRWRRLDEGVPTPRHPRHRRRRSPAAGRTPCSRARRIAAERVPAVPHGEPEVELLTIPEIAARRGVSRQHVHRTAQQDLTFPDPVVTPGSTRPKYRSDEVDHYFANRMLRPGRRTDLEGS